MTEQATTGHQPVPGDTYKTRLGGGTGDSRVDAVVDHLEQLDTLDLDEHSQVYDQIHVALRAILTEPEDAVAVDPHNEPPEHQDGTT